MDKACPREARAALAFCTTPLLVCAGLVPPWCEHRPKPRCSVPAPFAAWHGKPVLCDKAPHISSTSIRTEYTMSPVCAGTPTSDIRFGPYVYGINHYMYGWNFPPYVE